MGEEFATHPSHEELRSFLLGRVSEDQAQAMERHIVDCETCCRRLGELDVDGDPLLNPLKSEVQIPVSVESQGAPGDKTGRPRIIKWKSTEDKSTDVGEDYIGGYRLLSILGEGGMGCVYEARHERLGRLVALKVIHANRLRDPQFVLRFSMEAECIAQLHHPNIVQIYEIGDFQGQLYFAMELLGESLEKEIARDILPPENAAEIVRQLAVAIHGAHQQGVIHRDLKPANVLKSRSSSEGTVLPDLYKVVDFGIAKQLDTDSDLTKTGMVAGTPHYMAPEQISGVSSQIGPWTDIYSLGIILYELLTGRPPFTGATPLEVMNRILDDEPPSPTRVGKIVPRDLASICLQCVQKLPARRYGSAKELADDLQRFLSGRTVAARRVNVIERSWRWSRRRPSLTALLTVMCLLAFVGFPGVTWLWLDASNARDKAQQSDAAEKWSSYRANVMAAGSYMLVNNVSSAKRVLQSAPAKHRNWEWNYFQHRLEGDRDVLACGGSVWGLAINAMGNRLASFSEDAKLQLWEMSSRTLVAEVETHPAFERVTVSFRPDGRRLAAPGPDNTVLILDGITGREIARLEGHRQEVIDCLYSSDGTRLLTRSVESPTCLLWDASSNAPIQEIQLESSASTIAFLNDGKTFVIGQRDGAVGLWDSKSGKRKSHWQAHDVRVCGIKISPDDETLATGSDVPNCSLKLWSIADQKLLGIGTGHENAISAIAFSPDCQTVATSSWDQTPRLWSAKTAKQLATLSHGGAVHDVAFSPDGKLLATSSHDKSVRIWNPADGSLRAVLHGHEDIVEALQFDPTGTLLASASLDNTVSLWEVGQCVRGGILRGHGSYVYDAEFSPDGEAVASAAWDGTVRIWNVATETELLRLNLESPIASGVAFDPTSDRLATIDRKHVCVWNRQNGRRSQRSWHRLQSWEISVFRQFTCSRDWEYRRVC